MIDPDFENFLTCYLETLQVIPQQMQTEISCYLQSDLQHQHLLNVCSGCVDNLKKVPGSSDQLILSKKLIMCLAGIQDICDRRTSLITEMYDVLENQAQRLMDLQDKMLSCSSQSATSGTDNPIISTDRDAECPEDQKSTDVLTKNLLDASELDVKTAQSVSLRRKARATFRTRSQLGVVNSSHRAFPAWERGSLTAHNTKPVLQPNSQRTNRSSKNRCTGENRMVDKPHAKKTNSFSRYARAQQQRMQNQRRQQQRALCRQTRDVRTRENVETTTSSRFPTKSNVKAQQYLKRAGNLGRKFLRVSSSRSPARRDPELIGDYFIDDPATRSASNATTEDEAENRESGLPGKRGSLRGSPWIKTGERSSDEIEDSEHTDDSSATGTSLQLHEVKTYLGKERRESPHPSTSRAYVANGRQFVRQHKPSRAGARTIRSTLNRSTVARDKMANSNKQRQMKLARFRPCSRSTSRNQPSLHPSNRRESPVSKKAGTVRTVLNRSPAEGRATDTSTDQSSDERLYCWCKKIAFGDMIACDNKQCKVEWFHFACVGISAQPKGKWYCPLCRGESSKIKRCN